MRIGAHLSVSGGKHKALERGREIECESLQIFIRSVRSWSSGPLDDKDIQKFLEKRKEIDEIWPILSHDSYLINLAGTDEVKLQKSYDALLDELTKADKLKLDYVNMHPGNKDEDEPVKKALERISYQINRLLEHTKGSKVKILLETTAGQGNDVGYDLSHFITIIDDIEDKTRIGVCFDTCHSFAAGYDFRTKETYDQLWQEFDDIIGLEYLYAFHLNDAKKELGSKIDRHTHIGQGKIGKNGFQLLLNDKKFQDHPGILETPVNDYKKEFVMNLNTLRSLRN
ncbi:MAG: putative endonuclease 4 [Promethearchaeota archaeon]|nr:MAG: putative endonuclease 4 [Candidatus Lokiarchaeota archaeon]